MPTRRDRQRSAGGSPQRARGSMSPIKPGAFGYDQARHLLWRAGFGGTPAQVQMLVGWGPAKAVGHLLDAEGVERDAGGAAFRRDILRPPTPEEQRTIRAARQAQDEELLARLRLAREQRERDDRRQMREVQKWWLTRMIQTPRPLEERMVLFWHGHFATSYRTIENSAHMLMQNGLFRRHALGNFGGLLGAIIRDPAMLAYLDNNNSRRDRPNENLARELMELFSLGVGHYTERDIREGARALTGYTFRGNDFHFDDRQHDAGAKTILGRGGRIDGDEFVRIILAQRACPRFMARKLYRHFAAELADGGPHDRETLGVLDDLAGTLSAARYEIKPFLRRLFLSEHFYEPAIMSQQIKSPVQLVVGAVRSLNTPVRDLSILLDALDLMGQNIFYPPSVKGWDGGRSWINTSTIFVRQNILAYLLTGKKPRGYDALAQSERYDPSPLLEELARASPGAERDAGMVADYLLRFTIGGLAAAEFEGEGSAPSVPAGERARGALVEFIRGSGGAITPDVLTGMLLLITAMPEYQLC